MSYEGQFFVHVGVLVSIVVYALVAWWMICISCGCYDRMKGHYADYRYDLNGKSYVWYRSYQVAVTLPLIFAAWLGWWLIQMMGGI